MILLMICIFSISRFPSFARVPLNSNTQQQLFPTSSSLWENGRFLRSCHKKGLLLNINESGNSRLTGTRHGPGSGFQTVYRQEHHAGRLRAMFSYLLAQGVNEVKRSRTKKTEKEGGNALMGRCLGVSVSGRNVTQQTCLVELW